MEIGQRLKQKRIEKSLKLTDLAKLTGIPNGTLSKYENNINSPSLENLYSLSQILEVSTNWIITGREELSDLSEEEINILKKYKLLTERNKGKVENYIEERIAEQEQSYKTTKEA